MKYDSDFDGCIITRKRFKNFFISVFYYQSFRTMTTEYTTLVKPLPPLALLHLLKVGNAVYLLIVTSVVQRQYYTNQHGNQILFFKKKVMDLLVIQKVKLVWFTEKLFGCSQMKMHCICLERKNYIVSLALPSTKCYL